MLPSVSKRDYGVTTSSLLQNQQFKYEQQLKRCRDSNFNLSDQLGRARAENRRLCLFLEEKGLCDQWQTENELETPRKTPALSGLLKG